MIALALLALLLAGAVVYALTRRPPPRPHGTIYVFAWWNGCTSELRPGLHAANAIIYCCSVQPRARA